jgi:CcmD family protein
MGQLFRVWLLALACLLALPARADKVPARPPAPTAAPAAVPSAPAAPAADSEGFVPESRPPNMNTVDVSVPAAPLVATAYGFIWLAVMGFVLFTLLRTRRVEQELSDLEARIDAKRQP